MTQFQVVAAVIGISAFGWFVYMTSWPLGICVFIMLWANNVSQAKP